MTGSPGARTQAFNPAAGASRIVAAWKSGALIAELPPEERPANFAEGYAIQAEVEKRLGMPSAGYKLGLSNRRAMAAAGGLGRPARGFMPRAMIHASGAHVPAPKDGRILFELEVCFTVGTRPRAGTSVEEKLAAMSAAHAGIELVCSRFVDANAAGLPSFLGDDIGFRGYILGDEIPRADWPAAFAAHAEIKHGGIVVSPNLGDESRTDAVHALSLFIDDAEKDGVPIEPGMLITTGSLVGPYRTAEPGLYAGSLGRYLVNCTIDKK